MVFDTLFFDATSVDKLLLPCIKKARRYGRGLWGVYVMLIRDGCFIRILMQS